MPRKRRSIGNILAAHMHEQVEASTTSFLKNLSTYGSEAAVIVFLPSGEEAVFVVSREETAESHKKILDKCYALMNKHHKFGFEKPE